MSKADLDLALFGAPRLVTGVSVTPELFMDLARAKHVSECITMDAGTGLRKYRGIPLCVTPQVESEKGFRLTLAPRLLKIGPR